MKDRENDNRILFANEKDGVREAAEKRASDKFCGWSEIARVAIV